MKKANREYLHFKSNLIALIYAGIALIKGDDVALHRKYTIDKDKVEHIGKPPSTILKKVNKKFGAISTSTYISISTGYPFQVLTPLRYVPGFPLLSGIH